MSELAFLTFFSRDYIPKAHLLHQSLVRHANKSQLICCYLDDDSKEFAEEISEPHSFSVTEVIEMNSDLAEAVRSRRGADAIFSAVPSILKRGLAFRPENSLLLYLDADTCALGDFGPIENAMDGNSVGLFPHSFIRPLQSALNRYGKFNAGAIVIRNDKKGKQFLDAWEELCIEWCEDRVDGEKYSNQRYLTTLQSRDPERVAILGDLGGNVAPWNAGIMNIQVSGDMVFHNGRPIVFFHYHGLDFSLDHWSIGHVRYLRLLRRNQIKAIYGQYVQNLEMAHSKFGIELGTSKRLLEGPNLVRKIFNVAALLLGQRSRRIRQ